jgi:hypothetical protein
MIARFRRDPMSKFKFSFVFAASVVVAAAAAGAEYPPQAGTDRESAAYFEATEAYLRTLDLDDPKLEFERLGGTTATNWSVRKGGSIVADLKCTSGNTDHHGAVIAYRLGRELGFNIYPVAVYRQVDRRIGDATVKQQCALKEWDTVFTQYYWTRETFADTDSRAKKELVGSLRCEGPKPEADDAFRFSAVSAYGDPKPRGVRRVPYRGDTSLPKAARDFSNMMVIDTLIGNEDRFPGGNTFFRSATTSFAEKEKDVVFEDVRLFSLDNEAAFKSDTPASTHAARDLKTYLSRFDPDMMAGLRRLAGDPAALARITDGDQRLTSFVLEGIRIVLEQHDAARAKCGDDGASFEPGGRSELPSPR